MRLAFVVDPLDRLKAYKDSSIAMMRAARDRGHEVHALEAREMMVLDGAVQSNVRALEVADDDHDWFEVKGGARGNLAAGGRGVAQPISARDREIAAAVGVELVKAGIVFAGLDIIGDWLTEVNVTSPTCIVEIDEQTGENAAENLMDALGA